MKREQVAELILQALEHEKGGVKIYATAIVCASNHDLKKEWEKYQSETKHHVAVLEKVCQEVGIDPATETPGRAIVRHNGEALVTAMIMAQESGNPEAAQLVACECIVLAETKDHANWQLIGKCAESLSGPNGESLKRAYAEIEDQEDEHLYHTKGWCRELWIESLGIPAVLPPPEETRKVKTAIGAAKAEQAAEKERLLVET